jgi:hypothetical protein
MMTTLTVVGARGGQGASTVATVLALFAAEQMRTELETHDLRSAAALLGLSDTDITDVAVTARLSLHAEGHDRVRRAPVVIHMTPGASARRARAPRWSCCAARAMSRCARWSTSTTAHRPVSCSSPNRKEVSTAVMSRTSPVYRWSPPCRRARVSPARSTPDFWSRVSLSCASSHRCAGM